MYNYILWPEYRVFTNLHAYLQFLKLPLAGLDGIYRLLDVIHQTSRDMLVKEALVAHVNHQRQVA